MIRPARRLVIIYVGCDMPLYSFSVFLPTIINQVRLYRPPTRVALRLG